MTDAALPSAPAKPAASAKPPIRRSLAEANVIPFVGLRKRLAVQGYIIAALSALLMVVLPFAGPVHIYYAMTPDHKAKVLVPLQMPNMTNKAILSWATTAITEVMTMGFGDMDIRLPKQKERFTEGGWSSYMKTFDEMNIREQFKLRQLVLTTVPSNTPVILAQGLDRNRWVWVVQMPIIMTYATNNNVMQKSRGIVDLTIVRVPTEDNPFGIAIKDWVLH